MIQPGVYNIKLQRRADYSVELQFKDANKVPINLTDWSAIAQAWDMGRTTKYADFAVTYVDRFNGRLKLSLSHTVTATLPQQMVYDVMLINPAGERAYYLEGAITTSEGYTEGP